MSLSENKTLVLFDGVCNLCNGTVQFIINRDPKGTFKFTSLQSEAGQEVIKKFNLPVNSLHSILVVENNVCYERSDAALHIAKHLPWPWKWLPAFGILPRFIRDGVYDLIAKNRYRMFGKQDSCMLPTPELRGRFL